MPFPKNGKEAQGSKLKSNYQSPVRASHCGLASGRTAAPARACLPANGSGAASVAHPPPAFEPQPSSPEPPGMASGAGSGRGTAGTERSSQLAASCNCCWLGASEMLVLVFLWLGDPSGRETQEEQTAEGNEAIAWQRQNKNATRQFSTQQYHPRRLTAALPLHT